VDPVSVAASTGTGQPAAFAEQTIHASAFDTEQDSGSGSERNQAGGVDAGDRPSGVAHGMIHAVAFQRHP